MGSALTWSHADEQDTGSGALLALFAIHGVLGLAMHKLPPLATIHAIVTIFGGIAIALSTRHPAVVLAIAAYVTGSEVLWRMSNSFIFSETAKYTLILLSAIALARMGRSKLPGPILLYFALLLPAAVITYFSLALDMFRQQLMFVLSGPMALTAVICFCANVRLRAEEIWKAVIALCCPLAGVAGITLLSSYWRESIRFTTSSNFETSGGFGPNQVSSSLGLGALGLLLYAILANLGHRRRAVVLLASGVFAVQSAITFSRSGMVSFVLSILAVLPWLVVNGRKPVVFAILGGSILLGAAMFPIIDGYTGDKLSARFMKMDKISTGRDQLAIADLRMWEQHPIYGVGIGMSRFGHLHLAAAHTEYTRALAEHGIFGMFAYIVLLVFCGLRALHLLRQHALTLRPFLLAMMCWSALYMIVNGFRTAAPAFAIGLAFITIEAYVGNLDGSTARNAWGRVWNRATACC